MINNPIVFYITSVLIIVFALLSMFSKNIVYSLILAVMMFFSAAIVFFLLGSEYNAIIQAVVYGIAVPVIIGLSIMFTGGEYQRKKGFAGPFTAIFIGIIFVLAFVYIIMLSQMMFPDTFHIMEIPQKNSYDVLASFSKGIFVYYVWAFELFALLLTIIVAGLAIFKKKGS